MQMKNGGKKTNKKKNTGNISFHSTDGSIVYTTPSAESTVKIKDCDCKLDNAIGGRMNRDWTCAEAGNFYCPSCDQILCSFAVSAPADEVCDQIDDEKIRWRCIKCKVYVFDMNPITSTALEMGLPMRIEKEGDNEDSDQQDRPGTIQAARGLLHGDGRASEGVSDNSQVNQSQVDQEEPKV